MKPTPKPIKRSKELVPLSKEHHEGLLFGWKIKQGLRNGTELGVIAAFIQWFWEADLEDHFRKEEQVLVIHLPADNSLVARMNEEHEQIEALVRLSATIPDEDIFIQLADTIHNHIRFEERELFPYAEEVLSPPVMETISKELLKEKPHPRKWENAFWTNKQ
ncbi:MAG TPA: hemerythrin domain-containing protein [Flavisolibacter sp.]|jgi:hemerythrin-like domain-containing protein|nr:hemerythrin domain-containing protein [Flavisolibacter sp.]